MKIKTSWLIIVGLVLFLPALPLSPGSAGDAEKKGPTPAMEEKKAEAPVETKAAPAPAEKLAVAEKPAGLVGRVVAVVPESRTLIVDVPRGKKALRIGATVTTKTKLEAAGKATSLERLKPGTRVRIRFHRVGTGDEAISVKVLRGTKS